MFLKTADKFSLTRNQVSAVFKNILKALAH